MKAPILYLAIIACVAADAWAQTRIGLGVGDHGPAKPTPLLTRYFVAPPEWRNYKGTNYQIAKSALWESVEGGVIKVLPTGLVVQRTYVNGIHIMEEAPFFLKNHPLKATATLGMRVQCEAAADGIFKWEGDPIRSFDYGVPTNAPVAIAPPKPLPPKPQAPKPDDTKLLAFDKQRAEQGLASGQTALGMRYLEGRGVERNQAAAKVWLKAAADQGDKAAIDALARLQESK